MRAGHWTVVWITLLGLSLMGLAVAAMAGPRAQAGVRAASPFAITAHQPEKHEAGVALTSTIHATFDDDVDSSTVTSGTFAVHGHLGGLATGTFAYDGGTRTVTLDPDRAFHAGEVLRVSATRAISSSGGAPLSPYGWQFTAGPALDRSFAGFINVGASLTAVDLGSVAWGDYDRDGDLDILLTGWTDSGRVCKLYRNDGAGVFTDTGATLTGVHWSSVAWGDYDNDSDLDILLTGSTASAPVSRVYRNDGAGAFTDIAADLVHVSESSAAWGDYDNDGDLDILLTGATGIPPDWDPVSKLYRNDGGGAFTEVDAGLSGVRLSSVAWGDYDNDGDLDILLTGYHALGTGVSKVYRNDGGASGFTDIGAGLTGVYYSSVAWGDYDNDGDLDILLTGDEGSGDPVAKLYRSDGQGVFTDIQATLTAVYYSSVAWGDYDKDGDLDILLTGWGTTSYVSAVYRNNSAPRLGTVTPAIGSGPVGVTTCFTTTWMDPDGWEDLKQCYFHVGASSSIVGSVTLLYNAAKDRLWLRSDDGTAWTGGCAPGDAGLLENAQAIVHCSLTTVQGSGDTLSVTWAIEFKPGYTGTKKLGLKATDMQKARAKAAWKGTWTVE
jgi:predicted nucleotidyltransferase